MRICITLDDVLRAKTYQFGKIYKKNIDPDVELENLDLSSGDFQKIFGFKNKKEYEKFLYEDCAFEIFSEAPECDKMLGKALNLWQLSLEDDDDIPEPIDLIISNTREFNQSIGFTYFFLSKLATRIRKVFFPKDSNDIWKVCDLLVTADPLLLNNTPSGKVVVKIITEYNKDCKADYEYDSMIDFLNDKKTIYNILKNYGC